jgi:hypothetical protein
MDPLRNRYPQNRTSVHQRPCSYNARRRNWANAYLNISVSFFTLLNIDMDEDDFEVYLICGITAVVQYLHQVFTTVLPTRQLVHLQRRIRDYDVAAFKLKFGFHKEHAPYLLDCLFPNMNFIRCDNGSVLPHGRSLPHHAV